MATWEPVQVDLCVGEIDNYKADSDWLEFDCVCADKDAPNYESLPYDFVLHTLERQHFTCPRCGRQYRVKVEVKVEMYTPLAIKYPGVPDRMAPETLGLRTEDTPQNNTFVEYACGCKHPAPEKAVWGTVCPDHMKGVIRVGPRKIRQG